MGRKKDRTLLVHADYDAVGFKGEHGYMWHPNVKGLEKLHRFVYGKGPNWTDKKLSDEKIGSDMIQHHNIKKESGRQKKSFYSCIDVSKSVVELFEKAKSVFDVPKEQRQRADKPIDKLPKPKFKKPPPPQPKDVPAKPPETEGGKKTEEAYEKRPKKLFIRSLVDINKSISELFIKAAERFSGE